MLWVKGQSGNPGGRPRICFELRELAQGDVFEAYGHLQQIMRNPKHRNHFAACVTILRVAGIPLTDVAQGVSPTQPVQGVAPEALAKGLGPGEGLLQ